MRRYTNIGLLLFSLLGGCSNPAEVYTDKDGVAINGYDPVAYFRQGKPVSGTINFSFEWNGAKWYFSSDENRKAFLEHPEKYAPQYGGYCAFGMSRGYKAPTEATAWTIHNEKLYLNYNVKVQAEWLPEKEQRIIQADSNWVFVRTKP